jgi:glycosyltransferase involved in cell wall biosynthesis
MARLVSVIIPARDEARYIDACVRSVLAQQVDADIEVIVADGRSSDGTAALARAAGARVIDNPERVTPTALNHALEAARGDVVLRFDAHSEMPPGYVAACLRGLTEENGAVNVGGWCRVEGKGPWGRAVSAALASRFGSGNPRLWRPPAEGNGRRDVDSVPFGCFPTVALRQAGGWRADLVRNQDFELNYRLRSSGGRVVFDPAVWFTYRPRESLRELWRQYWMFGQWKAVVLTTSPASLRPRQVAPLLLLGALAGAALPSRRARPARLGLTAYGGVLIAVAVRSNGGWRTVPAIATMHVAWGSALLTELVVRLLASHKAPSSTPPQRLP